MKILLRGLLSASIFAAGCGSPSAANILLRKQNQQLQAQVDQLTAQHQRDKAALTACERSHPTEPSLPPERLDQLFTTHDLTFGKLTGGDNPDSTQRFDTELKVFIAPVDEQSFQGRGVRPRRPGEAPAGHMEV